MSFGKVPDSEFIHVSYSAKLAANNAFQTRNLVQEEAYKCVFPDFQLRDDSKAKDDWRTSNGGVCYSQGTGGTITGYGAGKLRYTFGGAVIIDDPHKASEARSDTIRKGVIEWFQDTLESRTNSPDTPIIVIMQRLHEEDLAGWLLDGGNGEKWEHLCLSAIQPDGSALWPEKHSIETLERMELAAPYVFAGQYLQIPSPPAGGFFKPDNIEIVDALPAEVVKEVRAWDLASSENEGDFTAGLRMLKTKENIIYIVDMVNQNQFDALVSLTYNIGTGAFKKSTLLKKLNEADYKSASAQFNVWNKGGGKVMQGLVNRRAVERKLFEKAL